LTVTLQSSADIIDKSTTKVAFLFILWLTYSQNEFGQEQRNR